MSSLHFDRAQFVNQVLEGPALERLRDLPSESVHCIVTSPPYFGLRSYKTKPQVWGGRADCEHAWDEQRYYTEKSAGGSSREAFQQPGPENAERLKQARWRSHAFCKTCGAWRGELGLEPTVQLFVTHLVEIMREARRVLRADGVAFVNMGDSFASIGGHTKQGESSQRKGRTNVEAQHMVCGSIPDGYKETDLMLVPFRLAIALQEDGWWIRNDLIWDKSMQCMPESVRSRHTRAHEFIFHLTKSARYFWDAEAIKEPCKSSLSDMRKMEEQRARIGGKTLVDGDPLNKANASTNIGRKRGVVDPSGRNPRTVLTFGKTGTRIDWEDGVAHYAVFPEAIPKHLIAAATSEHGACAACGAPWERIVERTAMQIERSGRAEKMGAVGGRARLQPSVRMVAPPTSRTVGWQPTCACGTQERRPCLVLDMFGGSGTTGLAAAKLGRDFVLIELHPDHARQARARIEPELRQVKLL